ncbi:unnamed protein product, partial [Brassica oleracea var. botrytis]
PISLALLSNIQDQTRISLSPPSDIHCLLFQRLLERCYVSVDTQAHVGLVVDAILGKDTDVWIRIVGYMNCGWVIF